MTVAVAWLIYGFLLVLSAALAVCLVGAELQRIRRDAHRRREFRELHQLERTRAAMEIERLP